MCHDEVLRKREKEKTRGEGREGREEREREETGREGREGRKGREGACHVVSCCSLTDAHSTVTGTLVTWPSAVITFTPSSPGIKLCNTVGLL